MQHHAHHIVFTLVATSKRQDFFKTGNSKSNLPPKEEVTAKPWCVDVIIRYDSFGKDFKNLIDAAFAIWIKIKLAPYFEGAKKQFLKATDLINNALKTLQIECRQI